MVGRRRWLNSASVAKVDRPRSFFVDLRLVVGSELFDRRKSWCDRRFWISSVVVKVPRACCRDSQSAFSSMSSVSSEGEIMGSLAALWALNRGSADPGRLSLETR